MKYQDYISEWLVYGKHNKKSACDCVACRMQRELEVANPVFYTAADLARAEEKGRREAEAKFWPIFMWLLGYTDFPERKPGEGAYHWRGKLRRDLENTITDFAALLAEKEEK